MSPVFLMFDLNWILSSAWIINIYQMSYLKYGLVQNSNWIKFNPRFIHIDQVLSSFIQFALKEWRTGLQTPLFPNTEKMATDPAQNICLHYAFQFKSQWQKKLIVEVLTLKNPLWMILTFFKEKEMISFLCFLPLKKIFRVREFEESWGEQHNYLPLLKNECYSINGIIIIW